jgi:hypothetical protein
MIGALCLAHIWPRETRRVLWPVLGFGVKYSAVRHDDFSQRCVEQTHLQDALAEQAFDLGLGDRGYEMKPFLLKILDLWTFDHASIADEGDLAATKTRRYLVNLRGKGLGVLGIARKDLNRQRPSKAVAQEAKDNLQLSSFVVAMLSRL